MIALGPLELGSLPRIAAPLTDGDVHRHGELVRRYADIAELRIDQFRRHDPPYAVEVCHAARALGVPLIATVRAADEGGAVTLADAQRMALFEAVIPLLDGVDIELRAALREPVLALARRLGKLAIVSHHDFTATPPDRELAALFDRAALAKAAVVKIVTHARDAGDSDRLLDFLRAHRARGVIVFAMGAHGVASRVFFPLCGSLITYGFVASAMAPGQLPLADLYAELRRFSPAFAAAHPA